VWCDLVTRVSHVLSGDDGGDDVELGVDETEGRGIEGATDDIANDRRRSEVVTDRRWATVR
jgi:hypothetical protein